MPPGKENADSLPAFTNRSIANNVSTAGTFLFAVPVIQKKGNTLSAPVQRTPHYYNKAEDHLAIKKFSMELDKEVTNTHSYLVKNPYIKKYADLDGHTKHWLMLWQDAKDQAMMPPLFQAAAGYVVESIATFEMENKKIEDLEMRTQVAKAGTRPDIVLFQNKKEIAWIDITASNSKNHIFESKEGWTNKLCVEITYDSISHDSFEGMKKSTGLEAETLSSPHWDRKNINIRRLTSKLQEDKRHNIIKGWIKKNEDVLGGKNITERMPFLRKKWEEEFKEPITPQVLLSVLWAVRWKGSTTAIRSYFKAKPTINGALGWYTIFELLSGKPETEISESERKEISVKANEETFETFATSLEHTLSPQPKASKKSVVPEKTRQSLGGQPRDKSEIEELPDELNDKIEILMERYKAFDRVASELVGLVIEDHKDADMQGAKTFLKKNDFGPEDVGDITIYKELASEQKSKFIEWLKANKDELVTLTDSTMPAQTKVQFYDFLTSQKDITKPEDRDKIYNSVAENYAYELTLAELDDIIAATTGKS